MLPMYLLAATTGPRFGELAGFRVGDLDLDTATLSVQRVVIESGGYQVVKAYPKGGSVARRTLALPPGVVAALKQLANGSRSDAPLWPNRVGGPQYYRAASAALRKSQHAAGLASIRLPRSAQDRCHAEPRAGMSLRDVQAMLGHASPLMTMTRYALPDVDAQRAGSARVAQTILTQPHPAKNRPLILVVTSRRNRGLRRSARFCWATSRQHGVA